MLILGKYSLEEREMRKNAHTRGSPISFLPHLSYLDFSLFLPLSCHTFCCPPHNPSQSPLFCLMVTQVKNVLILLGQAPAPRRAATTGQVTLIGELSFY